jgi:hypothetical protein
MMGAAGLEPATSAGFATNVKHARDRHTIIAKAA